MVCGGRGEEITIPDLEGEIAKATDESEIADAADDAHADSAPPAGEFVVDDSMEPSAEDASADAEAEAARRAEELDGLRIRTLSRKRRGAYRALSYCLIALLACAVGGIQAAIDLHDELRDRGWTKHAIAFGLLTIALAWGAIFFAGRARLMRKEAQSVKPPDPETPPDFSTLGDGSHFAKNLEAMNGEERERQ